MECSAAYHVTVGRGHHSREFLLVRGSHRLLTFP
jgi:hypothetical protein